MRVTLAGVNQYSRFQNENGHDYYGVLALDGVLADDYGRPPSNTLLATIKS